MNRRMILALCIPFALAAACLAADDPRPMERRALEFGRMPGGVCAVAATTPPPPMFFQHFGERMDLKSEQREKIDAVITKHQEDALKLRKSADEANGSLRAAIMDSKAESTRIRELSDAAVKAETALLNSQLGVWTEIRSILTPDQLGKIAEFMSPRLMPMGPPQGQRQRGGDGAEPPTPTKAE